MLSRIWLVGLRGAVSTAILFAGSTQPLRAQGRNHVFFEAGGSGLLYSANYERLVGPSSAIRLGYSSSDTGVLDYTAVFGGLAWMPGGGRRGIEFGLTLGALDIKRFLFLFSDQREAGLYGSAILGYRWLPRVRGLSFRLAATPLFSPSGAAPWGAVSLGYVF